MPWLMVIDLGPISRINPNMIHDKVILPTRSPKTTVNSVCFSFLANGIHNLLADMCLNESDTTAFIQLMLLLNKYSTS